MRQPASRRSVRWRKEEGVLGREHGRRNRVRRFTEWASAAVGRRSVGCERWVGRVTRRVLFVTRPAPKPAPSARPPLAAPIPLFSAPDAFPDPTRCCRPTSSAVVAGRLLASRGPTGGPGADSGRLACPTVKH